MAKILVIAMHEGRFFTAEHREESDEPMNGGKIAFAQPVTSLSLYSENQAFVAIERTEGLRRIDAGPIIIVDPIRFFREHPDLEYCQASFAIVPNEHFVMPPNHIRSGGIRLIYIGATSSSDLTNLMIPHEIHQSLESAGRL